MRIAFVSICYPPEDVGGIATQTYLKAQGLAHLGHEVYVISCSNKRCEYFENKVKVIRFKGAYNKFNVYNESVGWLLHSIDVASEIYKLHSEKHLDLVEFPELGAESYIFLLNRTKWNYIPTIIQLHSPLVMFTSELGWPKSDSNFYKLGTSMESTCIKLADAIYSSNKCSIDLSRKHYGLKRLRVPIIHTGIDTNIFYPKNIKKKIRPTIVFVGHIKEKKGLKILLRAACKLIKEFPNLQLQIIGPEKEKGFIMKLKKIAIDHGSTDLLNFPGTIESNKLANYLSSAHVFVLPSFYESGPCFSILEAMACELPVIATNVGGIPEIVKNGKTGYLVPKGNIDALENIIRWVLLNPDKSKIISRNARKYILKEADSRNCLKKIENFYKAVIEKRR